MGVHPSFPTLPLINVDAVKATLQRYPSDVRVLALIAIAKAARSARSRCGVFSPLSAWRHVETVEGFRIGFFLTYDCYVVETLQFASPDDRPTGHGSFHYFSGDELRTIDSEPREGRVINHVHVEIFAEVFDRCFRSNFRDHLKGDDYLTRSDTDLAEDEYRFVKIPRTETLLLREDVFVDLGIEGLLAGIDGVHVARQDRIGLDLSVRAGDEIKIGPDDLRAVRIFSGRRVPEGCNLIWVERSLSGEDVTSGDKAVITDLAAAEVDKAETVSALWTWQDGLWTADVGMGVIPAARSATDAAGLPVT